MKQISPADKFLKKVLNIAVRCFGTESKGYTCRHIASKPVNSWFSGWMRGHVDRYRLGN